MTSSYHYANDKSNSLVYSWEILLFKPLWERFSDNKNPRSVQRWIAPAGDINVAEST